MRKEMIIDIKSLLTYFWEKLITSIPMCFVGFFYSNLEILHGIVYIVIFDTILGVMVGIKYKRFSSRRLSRLATKTATYFFAMASVWVLGSIEPGVFGWSFKWMGIFIILTEIFSNFEKLALLGFKTPTVFLARLNKNFKEYYESDNHYKEELGGKIVDKGG
jgi:phage-related holin